MSEQVIRIRQKVFGEDPYPRYLGRGLFLMAPGVVCSEEIARRILTRIFTMTETETEKKNQK